MSKKILVTGGAGYIGSHTIIELFNAGYSPIIVDNLSNTSLSNISGVNRILKTDIPFYKLDCLNFEKLNNIFNEHKDIFACIHFAAYKSVEESISFPEKYFKNNIESTKNILKCIENQKFKNLIFSSSCTVYGTPDVLPITESSPFKKAESPYGETKQICEQLIKQSSCSSISLRYFNPIGSHNSGLIGDCSSDKASNLVPIISEFAHGIRKSLIVNGNNYSTPDGTCVRDYIHVQDLASAHVNAIDYIANNTGKFVFNIGTGKGLSVIEIIKAFEEVNGIKLDYKIGPRRNGDVEEIYADCSLVKKELNWKAKKNINDAVLSAFKWTKKDL